jgi:hypothetical protein
MSGPIPQLPTYTPSWHGQQKPYLVTVVKWSHVSFKFPVACVPAILEQVTESDVLCYLHLKIQ